MLVRDIMTRKVVTVTPDTQLEEARRLMRRGRFRHLPVLEAERVVAVLTDRDIARVLGDAVDGAAGEPRRPVREAMSGPVVTVTVFDPIEDAARIMEERDIGCLPVIEDGKLAGIVTESDLFHVLVWLMGLTEPGTRLELRVGRLTDVLPRVVDVLCTSRAPLHSFLVGPARPTEPRRILLRVGTIHPAPLIAALRQVPGVEVVEPLPAA